MADFGQGAVIACCSLLAAGFGAATILNKCKKMKALNVG